MAARSACTDLLLRWVPEHLWRLRLVLRSPDVSLWQANRIAKQVPIAKTVPVDLTDLSMFSGPAQKITFQGIEFEIPWTDLASEQKRVAGTWLVLSFQSRKTLTVCAPPAKSFSKGIYESTHTTPEAFAATLGPEAIGSEYSLEKAIYAVTPHDINLSTPSNRAFGLRMVLLIKAIMAPTTDWATYNVKSKEFRGFQLGDPVRRPRQMSVDLFAADDTKFDFLFGRESPGRAPAITQAEINRIIQSVHRVPSAELSTNSDRTQGPSN